MSKNIISKKIDEICKRNNFNLCIDWHDFNANYGLEDISTCRRNIIINENKDVNYEIDEIVETQNRYVFDKESGETVYEIYNYTSDEEYIGEIKEHFNIIDDLSSIRNEIYLKEEVSSKSLNLEI